MPPADWWAGLVLGVLIGLTAAMAAAEWADRRALRRIRETLQK